MSDPVTTGVAGKAVAVGAAAVGAVVMAASRPPSDRRQLWRYAVVALGSGFLFGELVAEIASRYLEMPAARLLLPCAGLIGAFAWGVWGYVNTLVERVQSSPDGAIAAIKRAIFGS